MLLWLVTDHGKTTQKKPGSLLVNHDLGDQLKIVLCLFWGSGLSGRPTFTKNYYPRKYKFFE